RVKSGWAAAVLITNSPRAPTVLDSRVIELADPDVADARQPYHAGFGTAQTDTTKVSRLVRGVERFASRSVADLLADYRKQHHVRNAGVVVSSLTDPASIANQHMRAHASEGRLFRPVLAPAPPAAPPLRVFDRTLHATTFNGTRLTYRVTGDSGAPPVVFVHGTLADLNSWGGQENLFAQRYRVLVYSRRYHRPNPQVEDN